MSYQVIARKYRPQIFDEVAGQRLITDTLKNAILHNRVAHGYIFSGARGVGKTSTARILAKSLNCVEGPTVSPCGECPSCQEVAAGNSVDVLEIDAASNRGIDEIRELRETVRYLPARDRYKVFIIDEVHMLTTEAFNALLKTLEEPPPRSLFILATTEPHKLPATIQSRCQHFAFRLLDYAEIYARLEQICAAEKIRAEEGALSVLAQAAEGSLRDALSLLDQVIAGGGESLEEARVRMLLGVVPAALLREMLEAIEARDARRVLEQVGRLAAEGYELTHFAGEFTRLVRDLMVAKACGAESPLLQVPSAQRQTLADLAGRFSEEDLTRFFQILLRTESELRYSLAPRFHLEMGLLKLVNAKRLASLETLLAELRGSPSAPHAGDAARTAAPAGRPVTPARAPKVSAAAESAAGVADSAALPAISSTSGEPDRFAAIKALAFSQHKLLSSCLEPAIGWRFQDGEVRFVYPKDQAFFADLLKSHEQQEKLRAVCEQVLGQPVRIYVTLQQEEGQPAAARPSARERAARDPGVEAFRKQFDCTLVDVQDLSQE
jgi:DNA polymerase-3 subunit gamma/tau